MTRTELSIYQGDDYAAIVTVRDADGTDADITGYTAKAQIRRSTADADPVIAAELTCVVVSPTVHLSLPAAETEALTGGYVWDLEIISPTGTVTTVLAGRVRVTAEVTRAAA